MQHTRAGAKLGGPLQVSGCSGTDHRPCQQALRLQVLATGGAMCSVTLTSTQYMVLWWSGLALLCIPAHAISCSPVLAPPQCCLPLCKQPYCSDPMETRTCPTTPCCMHAVHRELSSTQAIQLQPLARHPQQEAAELGITALHVIIEKVTPQAGAGDAGGGGNRGRGSGANGKPAVLGLAVEYKDADGRRCVDLVNYTTVLSPDMFSLGELVT